jgi:hypothetical protein
VTEDLSRGQDGGAVLLDHPEDQCHNCQAPLAADQRYCVNCGERRGKARYSLSSVAAQAAPPAPPPSPPKKSARSRVPAGVTLVTGVATLLLAMGVGVLIGHDSNSNTPTKASQPVVTVLGGGAGTAAAATAAHAVHKAKATAKKTTKASSSTSSHTATVKPNFKTTVVHLNKQSVAKAAAAAQKVFGQSHGKLAPPTIQPGQACAHGAGCQGGKFTGNFFH